MTSAPQINRWRDHHQHIDNGFDAKLAARSDQVYAEDDLRREIIPHSNPATVMAASARVPDAPVGHLRYRGMKLSRCFEETVHDQFGDGQVPGPLHLSIGQEAVAVGGCWNLRRSDAILSTHRGHHHCLAKGASPDRLMAELLGRSTGYSHGRGGSMHMAIPEIGLLGTNGITGAGIPIATGVAYGMQARGTDDVTVCFFGEGATATGVFGESLNLASLWKLPLIYLCENNQYVELTPQNLHVAGEIWTRGESYGISGVRVDGNDVDEVADAVGVAVQKARAGQGPTLIEAVTYRWFGHHAGDRATYRADEEVRHWRGRDPLIRARAAIPEAEAAAIDAEVEAEVTAALHFAQQSPPAGAEIPPAGHDRPSGPANATAPPGQTSSLKFWQGVNQALIEEMERDERVLLVGADVAHPGGPYGVTRRLRDRFGDLRVRDTPISEAVLVGLGIGAAAVGLRPIIEITFLDFALIAMDQIVNQAAKYRYFSGCSLPLVIRTMCGAGGPNGAQHSQSFEAWYSAVPGLKVIMPSSPADAKGLLKSAIRDEGPVLFIETLGLLSTRGEVSIHEEFLLPIGVADRKRRGTDVTVVAIGRQVDRALAAATRLEAEDGLSVEVVDPRTLAPLDVGTIIESVRHTGRLVVAQDAMSPFSFAAEICALAAESCLAQLKSAPVRVTAPFINVPTPPTLAEARAPGVEDIVAGVRATVRES